MNFSSNPCKIFPKIVCESSGKAPGGISDGIPEDVHRKFSWNPGRFVLRNVWKNFKSNFGTISKGNFIKEESLENFLKKPMRKSHRKSVKSFLSELSETLSIEENNMKSKNSWRDFWSVPCIFFYEKHLEKFVKQSREKIPLQKISE